MNAKLLAHSKAMRKRPRARERDRKAQAAAWHWILMREAGARGDLIPKDDLFRQIDSRRENGTAINKD